MPSSVAQLMADPQFHQFTIEERKQLLGAADPEYLHLSPQEQDQLLATPQESDVVDLPVKNAWGQDTPTDAQMQAAAQRSMYESDLGGDVESRIPGYIETMRGFGKGAVNLANMPGKLAGLAGVPVPEIPMPEMFEPDSSVPGSSFGNAFGRAVPGMMLGMVAPPTWYGSALAGAAGGASETGTVGGTAGGATGGLLLHGAMNPSATLGAARNALTGASDLLASPAGSIASDLATMASPRGAAAARLAGRGGRVVGKMFGARATPAEAIENLQAIAAAHRVNSGVTPAVEAAEINVIKPSATSSTASFEMKPPPVKAKAAVDAPNPTTAKVEAIKATPPVTGAKPASAKPAPTVSMEEAIERLKNAPDGATRGKVLRDLLKAGHDKSGVGQAFSGATNSPLDPEDLATAKEILKQAGSFEKAASALDTLEHTPAEKRSLLRALREADRAK